MKRLNAEARRRGRSARLAACWLVACASAWSTTVAETSPMRGATGKVLEGYFVIRPVAPFTASDGTRVDGGDIRVPVINGRFSISVPSTDTCARYLVTWHLEGLAARNEIWAVPSSGTVRVGDVVTTQAGCSGGAGRTWNQETATWNATAGTWAGQ